MRKLELYLGRCDDPAHQSQPEYIADLYASHVAVFGEQGKGKKNFLEQAILQIHLSGEPDAREEIYILSFGNRLPELTRLPWVAGYLDGSDSENLRRIFRLMEEKLAANRRRLPAGRRFAELAGEEGPAHVTFVIEGAEALFAASDPQYEAYQETLTRLAREGLACGLSLILSATAPSGGLVRLLGHGFRRVVAYTLTKKEDYGSIFPGRIREPLPLPGRGLALVEREAFEFQGYLAGPEDSEEHEAFLCWAAGQVLAPRCRYRPEKLKILSGELTAESWPQFCAQPALRPGWFTAGLDYERVAPVKLELKTAGAIAITGKKRSGKTNLLRGLLAGARQIPGCRFVLYEDGRGKLRETADLLEGCPTRTVYSFDELLAEVTGTTPETAPVSTPTAPVVLPELPEPIPEPLDLAQLLTGEAPVLPEPMPPEDGRSAAAAGAPFAQAAAMVFPEPLRSEDAPAQLPQPERGCSAPNLPSAHTAAPVQPEMHFAPVSAPFTVYVIQSNRFYLDDVQIERLSPYFQTAAEHNCLFVFSEVKSSSRAAGGLLGGQVPYIFVLDNIVSFCQNCSKASRFSEWNIRELKEEYGAGASFCAGEGFLFDADADELVRFKALKQPERASA